MGIRSVRSKCAWGLIFAVMFVCATKAEAESVDVFKDVAWVGVRPTIAAALIDLVPDPLDGNYDVVIESGEYNETMASANWIIGLHLHKATFNSSTGIQHTLRVRAAPGAVVYVGGPNGTSDVDRRVAITATTDSLTLEGLIISGASQHLVHVESDPGGTQTGVDDLIFRNCVISSDYNVGKAAETGIKWASGRDNFRFEFSGNRIHNVRKFGMRINSGQGDPAGNYNKILNNIVYDTPIAIEIGPNSFPTVTNHIEISNNTLYDFSSRGINIIGANGPGGGSAPSHIRIRNNIIWAQPGTTGIVTNKVTAGNPGPYVEDSNYNNIHVTGGGLVGKWGKTNVATLADWQSVTGHDANSISTDPLFASATTADFHLMSQAGRFFGGGFVMDSVTSPSIDAGQPDPNGPVSYLGEPTPNGALANQGAYGGTSEASKTVGQDPHDVAIFVVVAPALVIRGDVDVVSVIVDNQGTNDEFSLTVNLNDVTDSVLIGSEVISSLSAGVWTLLNFNWNTAGASLGDHTLEADVTIVPNETDTADNVGSTTSTVNDPNANPLTHVADIAMSDGRAGGPWDKAKADVLIRDADGNLVVGATVHATWSGIVSGTEVAVTDANGIAPFTSLRTRDSGNFTITITDVVKSGTTYDSSANVETSDSIFLR